MGNVLKDLEANTLITAVIDKQMFELILSYIVNKRRLVL